MFGDDTPLVIDAIQIAALALGAGVAGTLLWRRRNREPSPSGQSNDNGNIEGRVRVLERIATDRSIDLADEIEALRNGDITQPGTKRERA